MMLISLNCWLFLVCRRESLEGYRYNDMILRDRHRLSTTFVPRGYSAVDRVTFTLASVRGHADGSDDASNDPFGEFRTAMQRVELTSSSQAKIESQVVGCGFETSMELTYFARDFVDRPELISSLLQSDFEFSPLLAHQTRSAIMYMLKTDENTSVISSSSPSTSIASLPNEDFDANQSNIQSNSDVKPADTKASIVTNNDMHNDMEEKQDIKPLFKAVIVNQKAKTRRKPSSSGGKSTHEYGLPSNYKELHPLLDTELDAFYNFMTQPTAASQDAPIRATTADVYMNHAKLFLGWYNGSVGKTKKSTKLSLFSVFESKERESANLILEFIMWLRKSRSISASYEANILRGLTKLIKFRFAKESTADPSYGQKSFEDIPLIREIRRLHTDANKRQTKSPRSSDEDKKWLSWTEYLRVVEILKAELLDLINEFERKSGETSSSTNEGSHEFTAAERKIATVYQYYLVVAFFSCIPDRQRTIRELELGRSFIKDSNGLWVVKHGPDDYKTGNVYGDRPPLVLAPELCPAIDRFLERWRPCLCPTSDLFFVQPRTGKPFSKHSVYAIVTRSCYKYTGKKTNPHLLRDMIVTHVRDSDASEKQLEALALYMGHSINMQRTSYDRRTLTQKVAPAVELLHLVNKKK